MPTLLSQILPRAELTPSTIEEMFNVFNENFAQTSLDVFQRDLSNKDWVILLRDDANRVQGFSTLALPETKVARGTRR